MVKHGQVIYPLTSVIISDFLSSITGDYTEQEIIGLL